MHTRIALVGCLVACSGGKTGSPQPPDSPALVDAALQLEVVDVGSSAVCNGNTTSEIQFTQETGCVNDGSVEFCIPENDQNVIAQLAAIDPSITCAAGGGRAGCFNPPGRWLCFYPTDDTKCVARHGAMTDEAWADMCAIAALPEVVAIVPTWFE